MPVRHIAGQQRDPRTLGKWTSSVTAIYIYIYRAAAHEVYTLCDLQLSTMPALLEKLEAALTTASVSPRSKENVTIQDWASGPASRTGWGH